MMTHTCKGASCVGNAHQNSCVLGSYVHVVDREPTPGKSRQTKNARDCCDATWHMCCSRQEHDCNGSPHKAYTIHSKLHYQLYVL